MKTQFLTPARNGKPGEIIEVENSAGDTVTFIEPVPYSGKPGEAKIITTRVQRAEQQQYAQPVPYFALTPAERDALEAERKQLSDSLPTLSVRDRILAEERIQSIEADLKRARSGDATARRSEERQQERVREGTGDERIGANPTGASNSGIFGVRAVNWDGPVGSLDAKSATTKETVCCVGQYLCEKCRAKSAA